MSAPAAPLSCPLPGAAWSAYVARCAVGDQAAFAALYDESRRAVYSLILMIVQNPADAEEVTLDVYLAVWNTARSYDASRSSVLGWLLMLARSRALDRVRSRAWRQAVRQNQDSSCLTASGLSPERQTEETEQRARLLQALKALSADESRLLLLAFFQGHTHRELAELLQQPLGTVKTRIRCSLAKLRKRLAS